MTKETGGPAFPVPKIYESNINGMYLRDYFAAKALAALINHPDKEYRNRGACAVPKLAKYAYEYADAMLEARK